MFSENEEHISSSYFGIGQSNAGEYVAENADLMVQCRSGSAVHFRISLCIYRHAILAGEQGSGSAVGHWNAGSHNDGLGTDRSPCRAVWIPPKRKTGTQDCAVLSACLVYR